MAEGQGNEYQHHLVAYVAQKETILLLFCLEGVGIYVLACDLYVDLLSGVGIAVPQKRSAAAALLHCSYSICLVLIL